MKPSEVFNAIQKSCGWKIGDRVAEIKRIVHGGAKCHIVRGFVMVMQSPASFTAKVEIAPGTSLREAMNVFDFECRLCLPHELCAWSEIVEAAAPAPSNAIEFRSKGGRA